MPMQLQIITAEREVFSGDVDTLVAPGVEGQLGILPNHAPLITVLQPGELMVRADGEQSYLALSGGYMEVLGQPGNHPGRRRRGTLTKSTRRGRRKPWNGRSSASPTASRKRELQQALASLRRAQVRVTVARPSPQRAPSLHGGAAAARLKVSRRVAVR